LLGFPLIGVSAFVIFSVSSKLPELIPFEKFSGHNRLGKKLQGQDFSEVIYRLILDKAMSYLESAKNLSNSAFSVEDWTIIESRLVAAESLLGQIPESSYYYKFSQERHQELNGKLENVRLKIALILRPIPVQEGVIEIPDSLRDSMTAPVIVEEAVAPPIPNPKPPFPPMPVLPPGPGEDDPTIDSLPERVTRQP
jgi:hypothetical protein